VSAAAAPVRAPGPAASPAWSGLLAVDKPTGMTSHDVVEQVAVPFVAGVELAMAGPSGSESLPSTSITLPEEFFSTVVESSTAAASLSPTVALAETVFPSAVPSFGVTSTVIVSPLSPFPATDRSSESVRSSAVPADLVTSWTIVVSFFQT